MNVHPGVKQPVMRDTIWNGKVQTRIVLEDGRPKGMKIVLEEQSIDTTYMNVRSKLNSFPDFSKHKCILENYIETRGHICFYYPKYHCELSPIERVWFMQINMQEPMPIAQSPDCSWSLSKLH